MFYRHQNHTGSTLMDLREDVIVAAAVLIAQIWLTVNHLSDTTRGIVSAIEYNSEVISTFPRRYRSSESSSTRKTT